jgi:tyrosine decarboxylase/aspartate 1-decarboxylase
MNQIGNETKSYSFQETGENESSILLLAQKLKDQDESFSSGRIFNSFFTDPHPFAVKLYNKFIYTNLTKEFHRSVLQMETEAVALLADLFQAEKAIGYMTSGGTEANIVAFWASKSISPGKDEILVTKHTHYSIQKICRIMGLRIREVPLDNGVMDPKAAERLVTKRTLGIHATAVYPDLGTIDPIEKLAEIATEHGLYLHVDAAYGGFILPFLKDIGYDSPPFDFTVPFPINSINISL